MTLSKTLCAAFASAAMLLTACGGKDDDAPTSIKLSRNTLELTVGEEVQLTANSDKVTWSTDAEFVAVAIGGWVQANHVGTTTIRATYKNISDVCTVTVNPKSPLIELPILKWGATPEQIKALEPGTFVRDSQYPEYSQQFYKRGGKELEYRFENNALMAVSLIPYLGLTLTDSINALYERFEYVKTGSTANKPMYFYHPLDDYYVYIYPATYDTFRFRKTVEIK